MTAYFIAQIDVHDPDEYQICPAGFTTVFQRYGGELLATSKGEATVFEGEWAHQNTVVMKFPSIEKAQAWYRDPEYNALAKHRYRSTHANLVLVNGVS